MSMKTKVLYLAKRIVCSNEIMYNFFQKIRNKIKAIPFNGNHIDNKGIGWIKKDIIGKDNVIEIRNGCFLRGTRIRIRGNNNRIVFDENCDVGINSSFWMEGNDITIFIGAGSTFTHAIHFCAQENGVSIRVGKDCMFSNNITVRTSDSHPIFDLQTEERINKAKDVVIGNHVWVAPNTKILKGAQIDDGAIIGSDTMVNRHVPANTLAVGHPATIVKQNVKWTRESLF